jgi:hypothetical protein
MTIFRNLLQCTAVVWIGAACSGITEVTNYDQTLQSDLDNPQGALIREASAQSDFIGAAIDAMQYGGLISDELHFVTAFTNPATFGDRRNLTQANQNDPNIGQYDSPYQQFTKAHIQIIRALQALRTYDPTMRTDIGQMYAEAGFVETFFVEEFCSGVPIAAVVDGIPTTSTTLSRDALTSLALTHFDSAIVFATGSAGTNAQLVALAEVGRARVLLDVDSVAEAASAVANTPVGFSDSVAVDGNIWVNLIPLLTTNYATIGNIEGTNGLAFVEAGQSGDTRVGLDSTPAASGLPTLYSPAKYPSLTSSIVLASGVEAQLIVAEAQLRGGNVSGWAAILNTLRAGASPPLPSIPTDSTTAATASLRQDVMFRERALWLFLTGHRQGDLRRLIRAYHRNVDAVFPIGDYGGGFSYGSATAFIPFGEAGNSNYQGCLEADQP